MTKDTLHKKGESFINKNSRSKYFRGFKGVPIEDQNTLFKG